MNGLLLGTHAFLWLAEGSTRLPHATLAAVHASPRPRYLSIVSAWEIAIKHGLGKLQLTFPPADLFGLELNRRGIEILPLAMADILLYDTLPFPDPTTETRLTACWSLRRLHAAFHLSAATKDSTLTASRDSGRRR